MIAQNAHSSLGLPVDVHASEGSTYFTFNDHLRPLAVREEAPARPRPRLQQSIDDRPSLHLSMTDCNNPSGQIAVAVDVVEPVVVVQQANFQRSHPSIRGFRRRR